MPTHGDLPDPDALWRLNGGHGRPPSAGAGTPAWDPPPPKPQRRPTLTAPPAPPPSPPRNAASREEPADRAGSMIWLVIAVLLCVGAIVAISPDALYGPAAAVVTFMDAGPGFPQMLLYIALAAIPVTLLHELGHALAARRLLGTPVTVAVGSVGPLAQLELGKISVSLNALGSPARVAGSASFDASRARAFDVLLIALAGPAASAIGLVLCLAVLRLSPAAGPLHDLLWTSTLMGVAAILNLIPFTYQERRDGPRLQTDGRLALDAARVLGALR